MARMLDLTYEDSTAPVSAADRAVYAEMTKPAPKPRAEKPVEVDHGAVARVAYLDSHGNGGGKRTRTALAIQYLDSICNGAGTEDGVGFSKFDTTFGKSLAHGINHYGDLTPRQFPSAQRLCAKYRRQLQRAGFDMAAIAAEVHPKASASDTAPAAPAQTSRTSQRITLSIRVLRRTERAIFVETQHGKRQAWLPTSQIDWDAEHVSLPLWLMREKFPEHPVHAAEVATA